MILKTVCPNCNVYTEVILSYSEYMAYLSSGKLPVDFDDRAVCCCCRDDGYIINRKIV